MVSQQIQNFISVIKHGSNVNTYKLAWGKAILEICCEDQNIKVIPLDRIAKKMYQFYWNQTIYFDLIQGNNPNKRAEFLSVIRKDIEAYYSKHQTRQPIHFERIEDKIELDIKRLVRIIKTDVSWRFLILDKKVLDIYQYNKGDDELLIENAKEFKVYHSMLSDVINFKWTQALENFNTSPRIAKKVRVIDFPDIKRKSLGPFKKFLNIENPHHNCFICGNSISLSELAIDHLIPWSYLFSDDLWNLVYVHKSCNSSKSNIIPSEKEIQKLEERNQSLFNELSRRRDGNKDTIQGEKKRFFEMETAIRSDYVRKFWIGCK